MPRQGINVQYHSNLATRSLVTVTVLLVSVNKEILSVFFSVLYFSFRRHDFYTTFFVITADWIEAILSTKPTKKEPTIN